MNQFLVRDLFTRSLRTFKVSLGKVSVEGLKQKTVGEIFVEDLCTNMIVRRLYTKYIQDLFSRSLQEVWWQDLFFQDFVQKGLA